MILVDGSRLAVEVYKKFTDRPKLYALSFWLSA